MVSPIALLQTDARWRKRLRAEKVGRELELEYFDSAGRLYDNLRKQPRRKELVVLGVEVPDPIRTAQHVHGIDDDLEIVILCDGERYPQMKQVLSISPFIGSEVRCFRDRPGDALPAELSVAAARTRGRRRHHAWLDAARRSLSANQAPNRPVQVLDRLLHQAPIGVMLAAVDGRIVACNRMVERLMGIQEREVLGRPFENIFPDLVQRRVRHWLETATTEPRPETWETVEIRHAGGAGRCFRMNGSLVNARANQRLVLVLLEDITAASRREQALRESREELEDLAGRLLTAQEDERIRLAGELHDDITQRMAMLALELGRMERRPHQLAEVREDLGGARERMTQLAADLQSLSRQLHPSILTHLGLADAITAECARLSKIEGISIEFAPRRLPQVIPSDVSLCLYRILQEALRNVVKHSRTKQARVALVGTPDGVKLSVRDSGVGFETSRATRTPGLGLVSMTQRARLVQGALSVRSQPGQGTTVEVSVPLPTKS